MPQLGETITEGTITRWFKQVGEIVEVDEPLFEVSTDKVDSEVPSPISGTVAEILVAEGETVSVGVRLAVLSSAGETTAAVPVPVQPAEPPPVPIATPPPGSPFTSPIVRRLAAEAGIDPATIRGSGAGGRVTRADVEAAMRPASAPAPAPAPASVPSGAVVPHVYTSVEVDLEALERVRSARAAEWRAEEGFDLGYLPFVVRAWSDVARDYPHVNASVVGDSLVVHRDLDLGVVVDLDDAGTVTPVLHGVDGMRLRLVAVALDDLAQRARSGALGPAEVVGATFTVTDASAHGAMLTLPVVDQPQVASLTLGSVGKAPVVVAGPGGEDAIAVHHVGHLGLAWDHRAFDGAYATAFLAAVGDVLETRDWASEMA